MLAKAQNEVKTAIVMLKTNQDYTQAKVLLNKAEGNVRKATAIVES